MNKTKILNAKANEIGERTIQFVISSEVVDRDGDILKASGCDFTNYAKNPVFCSFHNTRDFPLGKALNWKVEGNQVICDVYFPTIEELSTDPENASEKAKLVDFTYHCYKTGMLNAVSVGFIIKDYTENKETGGLNVNKWELLEFSAVCVPANQDAIAQARKSFGEANIIHVEKTVEDLEKELSDCRKELEECRKKMQKDLNDEIDIDSIEKEKEEFDLAEINIDNELDID